MNNLIRTEWLKIRKYNAFWWIMGVTALAYPGINYLFYLGYRSLTGNETQAAKLATLLVGNPFTFPEASLLNVRFAFSSFIRNSVSDNGSNS